MVSAPTRMGNIHLSRRSNPINHQKGTCLFLVTGTFVYNNRRNSGFDIDQPDKSDKTENASDVHHLLPKQNPQFPIPMSNQVTMPTLTTRSPGSVSGSLMGNGQREVDPRTGAIVDEYVPFESQS